jgi:hypothetical protein
MTRKAWEDRIVGARMAADERFTDQVQASEFTRQQWGLIMTAVEFEVEHPGDADRARIVADTSKLPQILPELDNVEQQMSAMGAGGEPDRSRGGFLDSLKSAVGLGGGTGGGSDAEREESAERLAQAYAHELQALLEERGRWREVRDLAAAEQTD